MPPSKQRIAEAEQELADSKSASSLKILRSRAMALVCLPRMPRWTLRAQKTRTNLYSPLGRARRETRQMKMRQRERNQCSRAEHRFESSFARKLSPTSRPCLPLRQHDLPHAAAPREQMSLSELAPVTIASNVSPILRSSQPPQGALSFRAPPCGPHLLSECSCWRWLSVRRLNKEIGLSG